MDFFEAQDRAKRKTTTLVSLFVLAALATGFAIYLVISGALMYLSEGTAEPEFWDWTRLGWALGLTLAIMVSCSFYKISALQSGGGAVARMLGGERLPSNPSDPKLQQLRNVVEEMAIASGVRVPEIYVLEGEPSINAFAAGYTLDNAAVAVSRGALEQLDRDELQGVVAHEFSHILNGDMRINTRLVGILFGILVIAVIGRLALQGFGRASIYGGGRRSRRSDSGGGGAILVILAAAFAIMIIGYIGVFFGRMIQSAISRQREYLADAAAVQFTRNPGGISNALRRIKSSAEGSRVRHPDAVEAGHMFFASALKRSLGGAFATHPPLDQRIAAIDPNDVHAKSPRSARPSASKSAPPPRKRDRADFVSTIANDPLMGASLAWSLLASLPQALQQRVHDPKEGFAILAACMDPKSVELTGRALAPQERFALLELALASIRQLPDDQQNAGMAALRSHALEDQEISFDEQCLLLAVARNLRNWNRNADEKLLLFADVKGDLEVILSAVALTDSPTPEAASLAFDAAQPAFNSFGSRLSPNFEAARNQEALNTSIERASGSLFAARKALIEGASHIAASDDTLSEREQTQIRSLCLALGCPLPR